MLVILGLSPAQSWCPSFLGCFASNIMTVRMIDID